MHSCALLKANLIPPESIMAAFVEIARLDQIPPGSRLRFITEGKDVAVFNVDGTICAIDDTCPHAGGSLGMGKLDGTIVTCPVHGMKFDVTTGCFAGTSEFGVASYPVKVVDGKIIAAVL
jgi:3-phenylpropionate/trans-cinnamate dioxygenase ferredoxin subunit